GDQMDVIQAIERANRIACFNAGPAAHAHTHYPARFIMPEADAFHPERPVILIAPDSDVNVADHRQPQSFARAADGFNRERTRNTLSVNRAHGFAVGPGDVEP